MAIKKRKPRKYFRRENIASKKELNMDWLKAKMNIRDKHRATLRILAQHRLMTIEQLMYWHPDFGHQGRAKALLQRHINQLHQVYLVDKIYKPYVFFDGEERKTEFVALGYLGSMAVGWPRHERRIRYHDDGSVSITPRFYHIARVADLAIVTDQVLKEMNITLEQWIPECKSVVGHPNGLSPDAFALMHDQTNGKRYTVFVEFDTGRDDANRRMKFPSLTNKFNRYKEVMGWKEWYQTQASQVSENKFPYLFFVTEDPRRFPKVPRLLEHRGIESTVCMREEYADALRAFIERMRKHAQ